MKDLPPTESTFTGMKSAASIKYAIKYVVAHTLYALGLLQLWQRIVLRRRAVVLMYHRVLTKEEMAETGSHPSIVVERDTFAAHMDLVSRRFNVMTVEAFMTRLEENNPFENSSCLVTFDDGWRDNYHHALPILNRYRIPALIFLPVDYIGEKRLFWQEALMHALLAAITEVEKDPSKLPVFREIVAPLELEEALTLREADPRRRIIELIAEKRKKFGPADVDTVLNRLSKEMTVLWDRVMQVDGFLTWEQVAEMRKTGIRFGSHGASHYLLNQLSVDDARHDIERCTTVMATRLKERPLWFSYPRGYRSAQVVELVKQAGYRLAFIANGGLVTCDDDRYTVRRINVSQNDTKTIPMFLARIVGLF